MKSPLKLIQNKGTVDILLTLFEQGNLNVSQLSRESGVSSGTLQRRLKELKKNGYVSEEIGESKNNRLQKSYDLTNLGRNLSKHLVIIRGMQVTDK